MTVAVVIIALLSPVTPLVAGEFSVKGASSNANFAIADESVHAAATEVGEAAVQFRDTPNSSTLLNVHLACRDLKSQLSRYRSYFGTAATHGLKQEVLPVIESALAAIKIRQDLETLEAKRVQLTRKMAESCRLILVSERL